MKRVPDHVQAGVKQCEALGAKLDWIVQQSGIVGTIWINNKCRTLYMSKTPSDYHAPRRVQRDCRRIIREMTNA